jgi:hypothetical protein
VVDVYHAGGVRERFIYRVSELASDGVPHTILLQRGGLEVARAASGKDARSPLRMSFHADVARLLRDDRSFFDSPMRWASGQAAENIVDEALADRVAYDPTPLATRFPRRWFYSTENEHWFLPSDMRDVRWDRDDDDAFAAHPAWTNARRAVRERAAPEGGWATPVFANRPVAVMFRERVRSSTRVGSDGSMVLVELVSPPESRLVVIVIERPTSDAAIASLASSLDAMHAVWISNPMDWRPALEDLPWLPAGRDSRGRGCVVIDDVGILRADQFTRALSSGDPRLHPAAIRERMRQRVARLRQS